MDNVQHAERRRLLPEAAAANPVYLSTAGLSSHNRNNREAQPAALAEEAL